MQTLRPEHREARYPKVFGVPERPDCMIVGPFRYRVKAKGRFIPYWMPAGTKPRETLRTPAGSLIVTEEREGRLDWFYLPTSSLP